MRILYLCHRFPFPPTRGGKIRPFNMIRHFARSHEVVVASLVRSRAEAEAGEGIAPYCAHFEMARVRDPLQTAQMVARLPTPEPSSLAYFWSPDLARRVRRLLATEPFDLVFVHCSSAAQYVENVRGIPKILDFGDMDSQKWLDYARFKPFPLSAGYALEAHKLAREERRIARAFDLCTATTRGEWETLESFRTGVPTGWFPNGVDAEYFAPSPTPSEPDTLVFVGRMDYFPNQECITEFCHRTLPLIRARKPSVRLYVVGADPTPSIRRLADLPGVVVTGSVPDVRPWLHRATLMVAPLNIARGTQNKILEGMAAGVPVVTTSLAARGVDAIPGEHLVTADTPEACAAAILRLLASASERSRLARAGRARMLSHHAWPASMQRLDALVESCLIRRTAAVA